ncbi:MAG: helix-turn-helix transcriptional regulator [Bacteroidales bacterium]|nr:helix-turn-helix transcriptional regulator [Bacteroidales bacterium]
MIISDVALKIKQLREQKHITQEVFFFDTGIHIARIESGKANITITTLKKICDYFEISLSDFFSDIV